MLRINEEIFIDKKLLSLNFVCARGPGGQHVNKTSSAAQLRVDLKKLNMLDQATLTRLRKLASHLLTNDDEIVLTAQRHREQHRNRDDAYKRLAILIHKALRKPKPRKKTKPSRKQIAQRLESKSSRAKTKQLRKRPKLSD